ncbi:hypothetical protein [Streptomyces sp. NBC_01614]|uniref:hypothetical protein n=1 Tax=Streptomyces sp. NBC_01614 TaxID=2975897 RepID=UPI00386D3100
MTEPSIEAVPTTYGNTTFRSRLEADWAATLDANRITWAYEPEAITLPSGAVYIPDFWLPELGTWIEVKGPGIPRVEKSIELAQTRACHCTAACTCQWPGGELVILARTALPAAGSETGRRPPYGYANWETPHGPSAYSTSCRACQRTQWITLRRPWRCRACRSPLEERPAYRAVDRNLRFVEGGAGLCSPFARPHTTEETP